MIYSSLLWPIICGLQQATLFVGLNNWIPTQARQVVFLTHSYAPLVNQLHLFNKHEMTAWATNNITELNATLQRQGSSIQLTETLDQYAFSAVVSMRLRTQWEKAGTPTTIEHHITHISYPAVHLANNFKAYVTALHPHPLLCLRTYSGDRVWITIADRPRFDSDMHDYICMLRASPKIHDYSYNACTFACH